MSIFGFVFIGRREGKGDQGVEGWRGWRRVVVISVVPYEVK